MPIGPDVKRLAGHPDRSVEPPAAFRSLEPIAPGPDGALRTAPVRVPPAAFGVVALLLLGRAVALAVFCLGEDWLGVAPSGGEPYDFVLDALGSLAIAVAALELSRRASQHDHDTGSE